MKRLWLTEAQARAIVDHARTRAPDEACGLIGGAGEQATLVMPVENVAAEARRHFYMKPDEMVRAFMRLERAGMEWVGIYHSHPAGDPLPSATDVRESHYPHAPYVIVGLKHREPRLQAWDIHHGRVERMELHIDGAPRPQDLAGRPLSPAQKTAIILSALIAFAIVLVVSFWLLPPAPPIPTPTP